MRIVFVQSEWGKATVPCMCMREFKSPLLKGDAVERTLNVGILKGVTQQGSPSYNQRGEWGGELIPKPNIKPYQALVVLCMP